MSDIMERMHRAATDQFWFHDRNEALLAGMAEVERLRAALREIVNIERMAEYHDGASLRHLVHDTARAALGGK